MDRVGVWCMQYPNQIPRQRKTIQNIKRNPESTTEQKTSYIVAPWPTHIGVGNAVGLGDVPGCVAPSPPVGVGSQPSMQQLQDVVSL